MLAFSSRYIFSEYRTCPLAHLSVLLFVFFLMLSTVGHTVTEINWFSLLGYIHTASISVKYQFIAHLFFSFFKCGQYQIALWTDHGLNWLACAKERSQDVWSALSYASKHRGHWSKRLHIHLWGDVPQRPADLLAGNMEDEDEEQSL